MYFWCYVCICRDYTRPDLPSGSEGELGGSTNVPDLSAALAGKYVVCVWKYIHVLVSMSDTVCSPSL